MKTMKPSILSAITTLAFAAGAFGGEPMGTAFTYHGRLIQSACGQPTLNGLYDLRVRLYDALADGALQGPELTRTVPVTNGLFMTTLDFGSGVFAGDARWLELEVRTNNPAEPFVLLGPRQELKPTPYALFAANAATVPWSGITGLPAGSGFEDGVDNDTTYSAAPGLILEGTVFRPDFAGSGAANKVARSDHHHAGVYEPAGILHDDRYWKLLGNGATDPALNFLGTTDDQPLNLRANDRRVLRLEFPEANPSPNLIGGHGANGTAPGVSGATISGGGLVGSPNVVDANWGTVGGGSGNRVQGGSEQATVSGGSWNIVSSNSPQATIGGGTGNVVYPRGIAATIAGGRVNTIFDSATNATIGGGHGNGVSANAFAGTIGGGVGNLLQYQTRHATVAGGQGNTIGAFSESASIGGGASNNIVSRAVGAVITGGSQNTNAGVRYDVSNHLAHATIGGGLRNTIMTNSPFATIAGGHNNLIRTNVSAANIGGGQYNAIEREASNATIGGGYANHIYPGASLGTVGGGQGNIVQTNAGTVSGGAWNRIETNAPYATIPGGKEAVARNYGQLAYASGGFTSYPGGDAQTSVHVLRNTQTTGAGELFLDGYDRRMVVPKNSTWTFDILVVARSRTGVSVGWQIRGVAENDGAGAAFVGTPTTDLLGPVPSPWVATVNVIDDALVVTTLAFSDRPVRWVATVRTAEVTYAP